MKDKKRRFTHIRDYHSIQCPYVGLTSVLPRHLFQPVEPRFQVEIVLWLGWFLLVVVASAAFVDLVVEGWWDFERLFPIIFNLRLAIDFLNDELLL